MRRKGIVLALVMVSILVFSFNNRKSQLTTTSIVLNAIEDFELVTGSKFVPAYKDKKRNALAINASKYKGQFAKVNYRYKGKDQKFTLKLTSLTETDGESTYRILIDGQLISEFQNPETKKDYVPYVHNVENVYLKNGQLIQIAFNSHSNGKIPEGDAFAYSRGRWRSLQLIP